MENTCDVVEVVCFAEGPEETTCDFVADGYYVHGDAVAGEGVTGFERVIVDFPDQVLNV